MNFVYKVEERDVGEGTYKCYIYTPANLDSYGLVVKGEKVHFEVCTYVCTEVETVQSNMNLLKHKVATFILIIVLLCTAHTRTGTQTKLHPF